MASRRHARDANLRQSAWSKFGTNKLINSHRDTNYQRTPRQFKLLDIYLLMFGLKVFERTKIERILNITLRVHFILNNYHTFTYHTYNFLKSDSDLYSLSYIILYFTIILTHHSAWYRRHEMEKLITIVFDLAEVEQLKKLHLAARISFFSILLNNVLMAVSIQLWWIPTGSLLATRNLCCTLAGPLRWYHHVIVFYKAYAYAFFESNWLISTAVIYVYCVYAIALIEHGYFHHRCAVLMQLSSCNLSTPQVALVYRKLKLAFASVKCLHNLFDVLFNILPVCWLGFLFFLLSGNVVIQVNAASAAAGKTGNSTAAAFDTSYRTSALFLISEYIALFVFLASILCSVYVASAIVEDMIRTRSNFLFDILVDCPSDLMKADFICMLERNSLKLTGYNLFEVDKRLLLSFCAGLISFSVLFANLSGADI